MKNAQSHILKTMVLMVLAAFNIQAQALRCDLTGKDTTGGFKQCLDLTALKGKNLTIPSNVTRIDNKGLAECTRADTTTAGIVFIVDQSSSMDVLYAYVNPAKTDTFYYQDSLGCPPGNAYPTPTSTGGANIVPNGAILVGSKYLPVLKSNVGCQDASGDPFVIREAAVSQTAAYISQVAPSTVIGYLPFAYTVLPGSQRPIAATAANVAANGQFGSKLVIQSFGGTNYDRPMDSARTWLKSNIITPSLGPKSIRAIIFISDGATSPTDSDGTHFIDPTIPVYGIFLGKLITKDTLNLQRLTDLTRPAGVAAGANFYRVPPDRPDSVTGVIRTFLSRIIKVYTPNQVTVTNTSAIPVQSSIATGLAAFGNQGGTGASWRIQMDSVLALQPNTGNTIRIVSKLKSAVDSILDTTQFTLSTTGGVAAGVPGYGSSLAGNLTNYCSLPTTLQWLNSSGLRPLSFNETDSLVQAQLTTSKNGLATIQPTLKTIVAPPDSWLPSVPRSADSLHYPTSVRLAYGTAVPILNDAVLQTKLSDTLVARWTHPRDPQDFAQDTISIRPANKTATIYFSTHPNGDTVITRFDTSTTNLNIGPVYLIVRDQRGIPGKAYTVTVRTQSGDQENFNLTESVTPPAGAPSMPGFSFFSVQVPVTKASTNPVGTLQYTAKGDQMSATYTDPANGDVANCYAGINQNARLHSFLQFTDASGSAIPLGSVIPAEYFWSLVNKKIYLKYQSSQNTPASVPVKISAVSSKLKKTIAQDSEQVSLGSKTKITTDLSSWTASDSLNENTLPIKLNGVLEGAYRINVTATAPDYDSLGNVIGTVSAVNPLVVAWPDTLATLTYKDTINAADSLGPVSVVLTLNDQDFVRNKTNDTITVTALCTGATSADSVSDLKLGQVSPGKYVSENLVRNIMTPSLQDRILSCPSDTGVVIHYFDPVYTETSLVPSAQLNLPQAHTPKANPASTPFTDAITVELTTTDPLVQINYTLNGSLPRPGTPLSYANPITLSSLSNSLKAVGSRPGYLRSRVASELYLKQPRVLKSYIKDRDRDGQADAITIVFEKPMLSLPATIDSLYWNEELAANRRSSDVDLFSADSLILTADLNTNPFAKYLTGIPNGTSNPPVAKFPLGGYFNGLRAILTDSVGPVPHTAIKKPASLNAGSNDTLVITTSERIALAASYNGLFRFIPGGCGDLSSIRNGVLVPLLGAFGVSPFGDSGFTVQVGNTPGVATPQVGDCIVLDTSGTYTDLNKNKPGLLGIVLSGGTSPKIVDAMDGYPPVAGLDPIKNAKAYSVANNSDPSRSHVKASGNYQWVQPFDFTSGWVNGKYTPKFDVKNIDDTLVLHSPSDASTRTSIPDGISTVQVVASTRYIAHVHLSDHLGHFIKSWNQQFGFNNERSNGNRPTDGGSLSYLVWDELDSKGQHVGDGVYIWKVDFDLPNGKKEVYVTRTGLVR